MLANVSPVLCYDRSAAHYLGGTAEREKESKKGKVKLSCIQTKSREGAIHKRKEVRKRANQLQYTVVCESERTEMRCEWLVIMNKEQNKK